MEDSSSVFFQFGLYFYSCTCQWSFHRNGLSCAMPFLLQIPSLLIGAPGEGGDDMVTPQPSFFGFPSIGSILFNFVYTSTSATACTHYFANFAFNRANKLLCNWSLFFHFPQFAPLFPFHSQSFIWSTFWFQKSPSQKTLVLSGVYCAYSQIKGNVHSPRTLNRVCDR